MDFQLISHPALIAIFGGITGVLGKTLADIYISSHKDDFQYLKSFLSENLKSIDEINEEILKLLLAYYDSPPETDSARYRSIKSIEYKFKFLGTQINIFKTTSEKGKFTSSSIIQDLIRYRKSATLDIHKINDQEFNSLAKIDELHRNSQEIKKKIFLIKQQLALYKFKKYLAENHSIFRKFSWTK